MDGRSTKRWFLVVVSLLLLVGSGPAAAHPDEDDDHDGGTGEPGDYAFRESTQNMHALGHSPQPAQFFGVPTAEREVNSDIAFWGNVAFHGNYDGFRVIDISAPGNPKLLSHPRCNGDQGDIVVWGDILVRSWNSPAPAGRFCDGEPVPVGFEGVHVFDISDLSAPSLVGSVELGCGSHTTTLAPDLDNDRLIVYSNVSSGCDWIDVIEIPLDDPAGASLLRVEELVDGSLGTNNGCHDMGVILGDVNLAACASGHATNVFDIGDNALPGGSLEDPEFLYTIEEADDMGNKVGVGGRWHSAAFTWDGEVIVLGWEPGGGAAAECEASDPDIKKSMFFYDSATGQKLGQWTLPNAQGPTENCTIHNYNILPTRNGRYVAVAGHYQAGTWVTDFTDPAAPKTVGYSDPSPLEPTNLGGAWSSYWYNNFIYESEIQTGLNVFRLSDKATGGTRRLSHLNPQTQEFSNS